MGTTTAGAPAEPIDRRSASRPISRGAARDAAVLAVGWVVGLWLALRPTIGSGLGRMQSDWGDTRLNNYILEHGYRWLLGMPGHHALWSPPVFYPAPNTAAYSDILMGVAPFYWVWRLGGAPPDTAFQAWMITIVSLNYAAAAICARRLLRVGWGPAAVGALVFAFGSTRLAQLNHQQLVAQFYALVACYALVRIFENPSGERAGPSHADGRRAGWIAALGASLVLQFWAGYYLGWFLAFSIAVGVCWSVVLPRRRRRLLEVVRRSAWPMAMTAAGSALALLPLALPYLRAARDVGMRSYDNVTWYLPRIWSWIFLGQESWLYGWMFRYPQFRVIPEGHEHRLGIGLLTTTVAALGLWSARRRPRVQLLIATALTLVFLSTLWPNGASAWVVVYRFVPGAAAIRGVSRIALMLLVPAGAGTALFAERLRGRPAVLGLLAVVTTAEQVRQLTSYGKEDGRRRVAVVASAVRPGCEAFLYTPPAGREDPWWYQVDAMWASMNTGVTTINGYSGNAPPGWPFYRNQIATPEHDRELAQALDGWAHAWGLNTMHLCRVETPASD